MYDILNIFNISCTTAYMTWCSNAYYTSIFFLKDCETLVYTYIIFEILYKKFLYCNQNIYSIQYTHKIYICPTLQYIHVNLSYTQYMNTEYIMYLPLLNRSGTLGYPPPSFLSGYWRREWRRSWEGHWSLLHSQTGTSSSPAP